MGQPSMAIYVNELFREYDVQQVVRVGLVRRRCREKLALRDVVIASGACTDSSMNRLRFHGLDYAAGGRLRAAAGGARRRRGRDDVTTHVGLIFSGDSFYSRAPS